MTITLELTDEQAQRLNAQAAQRGQHLEEYLLDLAERDVRTRTAWHQRLAALPALLPGDAPALPDEALRRETMYRD